MILLYLLVTAAYLIAAWMEWQRITHPALQRSPNRIALAHWLPLGAIAGHAVLVCCAVFAAAGLDLSLVNAISIVACLAALFAWVGSVYGALPGVAAIALTFATVAAPLPGLFANPHRFSFPNEALAALHIAVALVAYALLFVAALQAVLLTNHERRLHRGLPAFGGDSSPPLLTQERFLFRFLGAGYALLTLALISGAFFSEELFGKPLTFTHKVVLSVMGWLVFGALLAGRYRYGWRGRVALKWILAGTALLLLAYIGSKFVLEVVLGR
jgi:ABC-type uncharacterized transport system permease subunit